MSLRIKPVFCLALAGLLLTLLRSERSFADNVLMTGANRGIGLALVKAYLEDGHHVYATYRQEKDATELLSPKGPSLETIKVDLADRDFIKAIKSVIGDKPLDILIHNAGFFAYKANRGPNLDRDEWLQSFAVNTIAPTQLTFALKGNLLKSKIKKVVAISSRRGSDEVNRRDCYEGRYAYRSSKAALNSAMVALAQDFKGEGIAVFMLHPGSVKTGMNKKGAIEPSMSAQRIKDFVQHSGMDRAGLLIDVIDRKFLPSGQPIETQSLVPTKRPRRDS